MSIHYITITNINVSPAGHRLTKSPPPLLTTCDMASLTRFNQI